MLKKISVKLIISIILLTTTLVVSFASYLTRSRENEDNATVGEVGLVVEAYFAYLDEFNQPQEKRENIYYTANPINEEPFVKEGIYEVNVSAPTDAQYIENFRVKIKVYSNVDTYFRIAIYEQLTLTYTSGGKRVEVATIQQTFSNFNYNNIEFFNNRDNDGFYYFKEKVKAIDSDTPLEIDFIDGYIGSYNALDNRYVLQMGFILDAVQAVQGPNINWALPTRPWDDGAW